MFTGAVNSSSSAAAAGGAAGGGGSLVQPQSSLLSWGLSCSSPRLNSCVQLRYMETLGALFPTGAEAGVCGLRMCVYNTHTHSFISTKVNGL